MPLWIKIGIILCVLTIIGTGLQMIQHWRSDADADDFYNSLRGLFFASALAEEAAQDAPAPLPSEVPYVSRVDLSLLRQFNEDAVAWLTSPDTVIDYPVAHGDNNDYYMYHLLNGKFSYNGTLFVDADNLGDFSDKNTVIYGHHMASGKMFASLVGYKDQKYYDEHPVMYLYTPTCDYAVEVFAGYIVHAEESQKYAFMVGYEDDEAFLDAVRQAKEASTFRCDVEVLPEDRIVTLSTCTYETYNARYVVQGKLTPLESAPEAEFTPKI